MFKLVPTILSMDVQKSLPLASLGFSLGGTVLQENKSLSPELSGDELDVIHALNYGKAVLHCRSCGHSISSSIYPFF